jgi:hypothetical protein
MKVSLLALSFGFLMNAQVTNIVRHQDSYADFPIDGVRIVQVDELHAQDKEENVYIFSRIEKEASPDRMTFQKFTRLREIRKLPPNKKSFRMELLSFANKKTSKEKCLNV